MAIYKLAGPQWRCFAPVLRFRERVFMYAHIAVREDPDRLRLHLF